LLSTLNVVKSIIAAAAQPPMSKAADVFGRFELVTFSAFFYVLGTIIEASSKNIQTYAGGQVEILFKLYIKAKQSNY
jgi:SIT family siderophore-iron:H+ symporter-like MFS transporter